MKTLFNRINHDVQARPADMCDIDFSRLPPPAVSLSEVDIRRLSDGRWLFRRPSGDDFPCVTASADYREIIQYTNPESDASVNDQTRRFLIRTAFECRFCYEKIVSLHAACVEKDGFAVAFSGQSGLGKSTRAGAWAEALGASWISGDRPAVRIEREGGVVCGVPWDGKEQIFRDVEFPLKAILEVRRSSSNYIRRLTEDQARALIMRQSFVPMWDTDTAVYAMANARALVRTVPVYRVFCGPDASAAREIFDVLFNHPENIREEKSEMKIKDNFVLRNVVDEFIVMPTGENIAKFDGAVVLNEVSAFVFKQMQNPVSREDLLTAMTDEYDVDEATAGADLDALLAQFTQMGLIEE